MAKDAKSKTTVAEAKKKPEVGWPLGSLLVKLTKCLLFYTPVL